MFLFARFVLYASVSKLFNVVNSDIQKTGFTAICRMFSLNWDRAMLQLVTSNFLDQIVCAMCMKPNEMSWLNIV